MLGFVTSLARDSEYFRGVTERENSTRVGPDVSKELAGTKVLVGDVWADGPVGRIALMPMGLGRAARTGRYYV